MQERVRTELVTRVQGVVQGLAAWGLPRLLALVPQARLQALIGELRARAASERLPAPAQRFGRGLWQRVVARFPSLAGLVDEAQPSVAPPASAAKPSPQLAALDLDSDARVLIDALRHPSAEQAAASAVLLGRRDAPEAREALLEVLRNADGYFNPLVRVAALQALVQVPERAAADWLAALTAAVRDIDAEVSMAAIEAVATHAPPNVAIEELLPVVLDETGYFLPVVRAAATRALERAGLMTTTLSS